MNKMLQRLMGIGTLMAATIILQPAGQAASLIASIATGETISYETNVLRERISVSWHKWAGSPPLYRDRESHTMIVNATHDARLAAIRIDNGSGAWNRITEIRIIAVLPDDRLQEVYHSTGIPYGFGCRIDFAPVEAKALQITLLHSIYRADFTVKELVESKNLPAIRVSAAAAARDGALTRVFASTDLSAWKEIDSYVYGEKTSSLFPTASEPSMFFRITQEITSSGE